jgi:hypothetical protein
MDQAVLCKLFHVMMVREGRLLVGNPMLPDEGLISTFGS